MLFPDPGWRSDMQVVSAAIDEAMGELVTIIPASAPKPNYPTALDRSKPASTVTVVFRNKARVAMMGTEGKIGGLSVSPLVETTEPIFEFSYEVLRSMPYPLLQGYRIERCCDGALFEITNIKPDGFSRTCVHVVQLGRAGREEG